MAERELSGKVALVTGAGSGIGKAAASRLSQSGARVGLLGRTRSELEKVAAEIERQGGEAWVLTADVAKPDQVEAAVASLVRDAGGLHAVFANAGFNGVWAPIE